MIFNNSKAGKCFICDKAIDVIYKDLSDKPLNRIVDEKDNKFFYCSLCIRKIELGYLVGLTSGNRQQQDAIREGIRRIKFDNEILKRYDKYFK